MTKKKVNEDDKVINNTDTDLKVLHNLERAFYRNNPEAMKRNTMRSLKWFRSYIPKSLNRIKQRQMFQDKKLQKGKISIGKMMFFQYDAIHKDTLPVWDRYPLVFFWDTWRSDTNGELYAIGINLHFLKPSDRFLVMKTLLKFKTEKRYRPSTKLNLSWKFLKGSSESKYFKHAVRMYRIDHVKSPFIEIPSSSWEMAAFLPLADWQNSTKSTAWKL